MSINREYMHVDHLLQLRQKMVDKIIVGLISSFFGERLARIKNNFLVTHLHILRVMNLLVGFLDETEWIMTKFF